MERTGNVLASLIRKLGIEQEVRVLQMKNSWNSLFAEPLAGHMWPVSLSEGELLLQADSPLWIQQLTFLKQDIVRILRPFGVRDVRFRLGRISQKDRQPFQRRPLRELSREDRSFIESLGEEIADEEIRDAAKKAAEKALRSSAKKD